MNEKIEIKLNKSTLNELKSYVDDFNLSIDDVILKIITENNTLKNQIRHDNPLSNSIGTHIFNEYVIHKLHKGKILVTENNKKVSNMKKVLIEAGEDLGMKKEELNPEFTTYEIGRFVFKKLSETR